MKSLRFENLFCFFFGFCCSLGVEKDAMFGSIICGLLIGVLLWTNFFLIHFQRPQPALLINALILLCVCLFGHVDGSG